MSLLSKAVVKCPDCGKENEVEVVRSLNARQSPELKERLLKGTLNILACTQCGCRAPLADHLLFTDPDRSFICQVVVGGELAFEKAERDFAAAGAQGTLRLVPSLNALIEKVKLLEAGLEDWAVELAKVLLLTSLEPKDLNQVLLFDAVDRPAGLLRWVLPGTSGAQPQLLQSALEKLEESQGHWRTLSPARNELRIDRLWAVNALKKMAQA